MPTRVLTSKNKPGTAKKPARRFSVFKKAHPEKTKEKEKLPSINISRILNGAFASIIVFILWTLVHAATPNPGHSWTQVGDGFWAATGTSAYRTFTFPDATATVMTTLDVKQGDIIYGSAASTTSVLPKDTNATRYLSNTGSSNNPAWSLINLANGVSGILPSSSGGTGNASTTFTGQTSGRTYTLPDANAVILTDNAPVTVAQGGTGLAAIPQGALVTGSTTNPLGSISAGTEGGIVVTDGGSWTASGITSGVAVGGRRQGVLVLKNPSLATVTSVYSAAPTLTATASNGDTAEGAFLGSSTTNVTNNASGIISAFTLYRFDWNPDMTIRIKTDQGATTTLRYWIGMFTADPSGSASPANPLIAFRYDAVAQATPFWQTVTCATTCVGAGSTTVTTSVPVSTNTVYKFRINCTSTAQCLFYINDTLVSTHITTLPAATQFFGYGVRVTTLAASIRAIRTGYISIVHNN